MDKTVFETPAEQIELDLSLPGQVSISSGGPKRTPEEKDALEAIRRLVPDAAEKLSELLESAWTPVAVKVRICELIFDRAFGRPNSSVKVTSVQQTVEQSRNYILSLVERVRAAKEAEEANEAEVDSDES